MTLHIVGAGLAGLACAVAAADAGLPVTLHEAAPQAGGRCRSFVDPVLNQTIDNGTHAVVGGNVSTMRYLRRIGSRGSLQPLALAHRVLDFDSGQIWKPSLIDLAGAWAGSLWQLGIDDRGTVAERMGAMRDYRRLWHPMATAALNTDPAIGSAELFRTVLTESIWRGARASRMHVAREDLSRTFVAPALTLLGQRGAEIKFGRRLRALKRGDGGVRELEFDDGSVLMGRRDMAVLALPWYAVTRMLDLSELPDSAIVNAHFQVETPPASLADGAALGMVGGTAQWVFRRRNFLAVTVSAAAGLDDLPNDEVAERLWRDLQRALGIEGWPAGVRIVKEKRATLLHTPETESLRPHRRHGANLLLAGDWTATGLPCTIESAIRSGHFAARDAVAILRDRR